MKLTKSKTRNGFVAPELFFRPLEIKMKRRQTSHLYKLFRYSPFYDYWKLFSSAVDYSEVRKIA